MAALEHIEKLHFRYRNLLESHAITQTFTLLPQDLYSIGIDDLRGVGMVDLVICGFPCNGFSNAGKGKGLNDKRSKVFFEMCRVMHLLEVVNEIPIPYIVENVVPGVGRYPHLTHHLDIVHYLIGDSIQVEAGHLGATGRRLRLFFTGAAEALQVTPDLVSAMVHSISPFPLADVQVLLDENHRVKECIKEDEFNEVGQPMRILPTLMSYENSFAYRTPGPGRLLNTLTGLTEEPSASEREKMLGFVSGCTSAPHISERDRREILGQCFEQHSLVFLIAVLRGIERLKASKEDLPVRLEFGSENVTPEKFKAARVFTPNVKSSRASQYNTFLEWTIAKGGGDTYIPRDMDFVNPTEYASIDETFDEKDEKNTGWRLGSQLDVQEKKSLKLLLDEFASSVFAFDMSQMGHYTDILFTIDTESNEPIYSKPHRLSGKEKEVMQNKIDELVAAGIVRPSSSQWASASLLPSKKDADGNFTDFRLVHDYRPLNIQTKPFYHMIPTVEDILTEIGESKANIYSLMDLRSAYFQCGIDPDHIHKTAFWGPEGLYEYLRMPQGVKNAPMHYQRIMQQVLEYKGAHEAMGGESKRSKIFLSNLKRLRAIDSKWKWTDEQVKLSLNKPFCRPYLDDIIVFSKNLFEMKLHLLWIWACLRTVNLKLHPHKCRIGTIKLDYLGHDLTPDGIGIQTRKVEAIQVIPPPTDISKVRAFCGIINYFRKLIPHLSHLSRPLNDLLKKDTPWEWTDVHQHAFESLKEALTTAPVLRHPDPDKHFYLHTDWSINGIGGVLLQEHEVDGEKLEFPVCYISRSTTSAEKNYSSYEGELSAVIHCVTSLRHLLLGRNFTIVTDCRPLHWVMQNHKLKGKLARWALILQEYLPFSVQHRPGTSNVIADALSRSPIASSPDDDSDTETTSSDQSIRMRTPLLSSSLSPPSTTKDPWEDPILLTALQTGNMPINLSPQEHSQLVRRMSRYRWEDGRLHHASADTNRLTEIPPPDKRFDIIESLHEQNGHFGVRRTISLVKLHYNWPGLYNDVAAAIQRCTTCDRIKASFTGTLSHMQPVPLNSLMYRWSCDLFGPLEATTLGNQYVMLCVEQFSKWAEAIPIPDKTSAETSRAFYENVLCRYGSCAEVCTDQGGEWGGDFRTLLEKNYIDHRTTSADHPQANGQVERLVQTVKKALRKALLDDPEKDWDDLLPRIMLAYRCSKQASLASFSPYFLLYGRNPLLPGVLPRKFQEVIDFSASPDRAATIIAQRAVILEEAIPLAFDNLLAAQHRDTLRYAYTRSGIYQPRLKKFEVGDFVYLRRARRYALHPANSRTILKVVQIKPSGVILLEGADNRQIEEHINNLAPCHLPDLVKPQDIPREFRSQDEQIDDIICDVCGRADDEPAMLLCDECNRGFHKYCLSPPLRRRPVGDWFCSEHESTRIPVYST
jgi:hypothetical protein